MADIDTLELDALWAEFHRVVNMTSQELSAWLTAYDADKSAEPPPEHAGSPIGLLVLGILQKRRADLTNDDISVMYDVVDTVGAQQHDDPRDSDPALRNRLMSIGHDPLKPPA
ncbi:DUF3140 domain-containing protein [Streptomyces maoxianensis]|uniref:DUF3140 domain-containing protein n=1 Tax=Streptomyces maoxianensis TaxID=1459942 RepID=A0ABV9FZQ9_9ACTN|nr:DUF3140 domain-containing protein [Streptomyces sp. ISL-1]MBT2388814.1 DUF3140 domain-containing protein [Streptomyces sp. ISL-1]